MKARTALAALVLMLLPHDGLVFPAKAADRGASPFAPVGLIRQAATKKHPYLLFTDWKNTPGYKHRTEKPYGGHAQWLFYVKTNADRQGGMYAAFYYQVGKDEKYAEKAKAELLELGTPSRTDHIRGAGEAMLDLALAYDWIQETLAPQDDARIKAKLAAYADIVYQAYPKQSNAHDRIMGASGLGAMALALAGYTPATGSRPVDWLRDATISLFIKDRFEFPPAFRQAPDYNEFCPALRGVCNAGGFCRIGGYRAYWLSTMCRWLLIYNKATGRNPLDDFPIARGIVNDPIWESMPNRMDSQQNTRVSNYWDHFSCLLPLLTPAERGGFRWYAEDPGVDKLRRRWTTAGIGGVPWGLCCYEKNLPDQEPFWTSFYSPKSEAIVFRRDWSVESDWLFFKCMNQPIPSHRDMLHHDNMSFELYSRGDYLLSDGGEIRGRMTGYGPEYACGHNTLLIDGVGPVKEDIEGQYYRFVNPARFTHCFLEPWLEVGEAKMDVTHVERNPVKVVVGPSGARGSSEATGRDADAESLANPVQWQRTILYPGKEYFLLVDRARSRATHDYEFLFHLSSLNIVKTKDRQHPGHVIGRLVLGTKTVDWSKGVQTDILTGDNPRRTIAGYPGSSEILWKTTNLQGRPVELRLVSSLDSDTIKIGRIWGRLPVTEPPSSGSGEVDHPFVSFHHSAAEIARITALLSRYVDGEEPPSATQLAVDGEGSALKLVKKSVTDLVGTGRGELRYDNVTTDAEISFLRLRGRQVETVLLLRGTSFKHQGESWISTPEAVARAAFHYADNQVVGHVGLRKPVKITIHCAFAPKTITYQPEPKDWIWDGTPQRRKQLKPRPLRFKKTGDLLVLDCPGGSGRIAVR